MALSFGLKQLVATNLVINRFPFRPSSVATHRRAFTTMRFFSGVFEPFTLSRIGMRILNHLPHTLCTTTRVTREGETGVKVVSLGKNPEISIAKGAKFNLNIPGIEKTEYTSEGVCVLLDLGLKHKNSNFDDQNVEAIVKSDRFLFIKGYVKKQNLRRNFNARVTLNHKEKSLLSISEPLRTDIKDGALMVTIPWVKKQEDTCT